MKKPLIQISKLDVAYKEELVLADVSLTINDRDFIGIIGPNGGGKTTLVKAILGLMKPLRGTVEYGIDPTEIGYLPQNIQVDGQFPISVREVVASGLAGRTMKDKGSRDQTRVLTDEVLKIVGLQELRSRPIGNLSGGEFQRAMLGRAIISSPRILILDEPDTHVDNKFEKELYTLLRDLNEKMAILLVSHDIGTISAYIKTIACVNRDLHYHTSNEISEQQLKVYNCPIEIITHGPVPHRVMKEHESS